MKEIWKDIPGYEGLYKASSEGKIKSYYKRRGKIIILSPTLDRDGYLRVSLAKNKKISNHCVHRLIAETFIPNRENKPQINHINNIRNDNKKINLEWATAKENINHGFKHGNEPKGENHYYSKLKNNDIIFIRKMHNKIKKKKLAKMFNVYFSTIEKIQNGRAWTHIKSE